MERENLEYRCQRALTFPRESRRSREKPKWKPHEGQRTEAVPRDGTTRSSDDLPHKGKERRGGAVVQQLWANHDGRDRPNNGYLANGTNS